MSGHQKWHPVNLGQPVYNVLMASGNIEAGSLFHVLSGNLSHQIEHHLFPDLPSNRYAPIASRGRKICEGYSLPYNSGSLVRQFTTTSWCVLRLTLPGGKNLEPVASSTAGPFAVCDMFCIRDNLFFPKWTFTENRTRL